MIIIFIIWFSFKTQIGVINADFRIVLIAVWGAGPLSYHLLRGRKSSFHVLFSKVRSCFVVITSGLSPTFPVTQRSLPGYRKNWGVVKDGCLGHNPGCSRQGWVLSCGSGIGKPAGQKEPSEWQPGCPTYISTTFVWLGSWLCAGSQSTHGSQHIKLNSSVAARRILMSQYLLGPAVSVHIVWESSCTPAVLLGKPTSLVYFLHLFFYVLGFQRCRLTSALTFHHLSCAPLMVSSAFLMMPL